MDRICSPASLVASNRRGSCEHHICWVLLCIEGHPTVHGQRIARILRSLLCGADQTLSSPRPTTSLNRLRRLGQQSRRGYPASRSYLSRGRSSSPKDCVEKDRLY